MSFSVLMSVYYKENPQFFDLALESNLKLQTLAPDDFVLVCDGPLTPELDAVIEKYQALYPAILNVYRLESNVGLGKALNYGLSMCKFDLIVRADSDDVCVPTRFETQISFMESHPNIALCSSHIAEFDTDPTKPSRVKYMPTEHAEIYKMAKFRCPINHMAAAFKKSVIEEVGSYMHLHYLEDYYLWLRVICAGYELANIGEILVHARVGNGMAARRSDKRYISGWTTLSRYMLSHNMINRVEYCKNMIAVCAFIYTPTPLKEFLYKKVLRKG